MSSFFPALLSFLPPTLGVAKEEVGEEGLCLLSLLPPTLLYRSSKGRSVRGRHVSSFFPASYIIIQE